MCGGKEHSATLTVIAREVVRVFVSLSHVSGFKSLYQSVNFRGFFKKTNAMNCPVDWDWLFPISIGVIV